MRGARKRARDRLTTPGRSRLRAVCIPTDDYLNAEKRAANTLYQAREEAGTVVDEERSRGGSGCELGTYVRHIYQVYIYMYIYIIVSVRGEERKQESSATKQSRGGSGCKAVTYGRNLYTNMYVYIYRNELLIFLGARSKRGSRRHRRRNEDQAEAAAKRLRTHVVYTPTCIYTGMNIFLFSVRGAREEASTVGDEIGAVGAAKVVNYVRNIYIYTHRSRHRRRQRSRGKSGCEVVTYGRNTYTHI